MKIIQELVDEINDELCSAKEYTEAYIEYKVRDNSTWANRYKEMACDELKHSTYLHDIAVAKIAELEKIQIAPQEMQDKWEKSHKKYVEKTAIIKQMLQL